MNTLFKITCSLVFCTISAAPTVFAEGMLSDQRIRVHLTAPLDMRSCTDGQQFSAVLREDDETFSKDFQLTGHLEIFTPDKRAPKERSIALHFDTLRYRGKDIPIVCDLPLITSKLTVTRKGKSVSYPAVRFCEPLPIGLDQGLGTSPRGATEYKKAWEKHAASVKEASRIDLIRNKRYGLNAERPLAFPSTRFTPFILEPSDLLYVKISSPTDIAI